MNLKSDLTIQIKYLSWYGWFPGNVETVECNFLPLLFNITRYRL